MTAYISWPRRSGRSHLRMQTEGTPAGGWAAQQLTLPIDWYTATADGSGIEFPVSGDATSHASRLLGLVRDGLEVDLMPWQERFLVDSFRHARDTPRPTHP